MSRELRAFASCFCLARSEQRIGYATRIAHRASWARPQRARVSRLELLARLPVANLQRAADGKGVELDIDRAVFVGERNADAIPVGLFVPFGDAVGHLEFRRFHGDISPLAVPR